MASESGKEPERTDPADTADSIDGAAQAQAPGDEGPTSNQSGQTYLPVMLGFALALLVVDQVTKSLIVSQLDRGETVDLFWKLRLNHVLNEGASFGFGKSLGPVIGVVAIVVGFGLIMMARRVTTPGVALSLGAILGGAWGNVLDRIFREGDGFMKGAVIDFIDVQFWPVWNVADMGVVCGGLALVWLASRGTDEIFA